MACGDTRTIVGGAKMRNCNRYIENMSSTFKYALEENQRLIDNFKNNTAIDEKGVIRWITSKNVPPSDILEFWKHIGFEFNLEESLKQKDIDSAEFLEAYRKQMKNRVPSAEELSEMRSAFGPGATVVDVFTGQSITV